MDYIANIFADDHGVGFIFLRMGDGAVSP